MCMATCQFCGCLIDTDEFPDAIYDTDTQRDVIACEACQEMSDLSRTLNDQAVAADNQYAEVGT